MMANGLLGHSGPKPLENLQVLGRSLEVGPNLTTTDPPLSWGTGRKVVRDNWISKALPMLDISEILKSLKRFENAI